MKKTIFTSLAALSLISPVVAFANDGAVTSNSYVDTSAPATEELHNTQADKIPTVDSVYVPEASNPTEPGKLEPVYKETETIVDGKVETKVEIVGYVEKNTKPNTLNPEAKPEVKPEAKKETPKVANTATQVGKVLPKTSASK